MEVRWNGQLRANRVLDNQMARVDLLETDIAVAGAAEILVTNPALPDSPVARLEFPVDAGGATSPRLTAEGIVTAAGFSPGPLAPGSIAAVFGVDLAAFTEAPPRDAVTAPGGRRRTAVCRRRLGADVLLGAAADECSDSVGA